MFFDGPRLGRKVSLMARVWATRRLRWCRLNIDGHTAGELITTETLIDFVDQADFNGMPSMLKAMREISTKMKAPNPNYIAPAFLATVLLSFLVKKKLVSNFVLVSTVVASHRTISCFVDR